MHTVNFEIYFSASPSQVWDAWTQPAAVVKWFGSDPLGHGVSAELDVRPGGAYSISFQDGDGTGHACFGKYELWPMLVNLPLAGSGKVNPGIAPW